MDRWLEEARMNLGNCIVEGGRLIIPPQGPQMYAQGVRSYRSGDLLVQAVKMSQPFEVRWPRDAEQGVSAYSNFGESGDYLVRNSYGYFFPEPAVWFEKHYQPVSAKDLVIRGLVKDGS